MLTPRNLFSRRRPLGPLHKTPNFAEWYSAETGEHGAEKCGIKRKHVHTQTSYSQWYSAETGEHGEKIQNLRDHAKRTTKKFKPLAERLDTECAALPQSALPPPTEGY
jgi:hypothetical protein